ncbi:MAG TPA: FHA domain-containing protein [Isosphaeraceae bacterium]|jgi:hypothetical protein|nr:FHA domain-containing protein [Isosphaeraceae bacterium]
MSLLRLIYYSAVVGGWAAFLGWLVSELALSPGAQQGGAMLVVITCALVGAAIGAGLNLVAGMANAQWKQQLKRVLTGLIAGGLGGAIGGGIGDFLFSSLGLPRAFGWMIMGAGIGIVEGLYERSKSKVRNGLIGGAIGGLIGGFLFDPILAAIASQTGMTSRATAFVILGMCIGVLIGLVQVVLKEAWLTVLDGYRPGRQLILSQEVTVIGRGEWTALPFLGKGDANLAMEHARIVRQPDGNFAVEDNQTPVGTLVNNQRVQGRLQLKDGDVITIGSNMIRFSERHKHSEPIAVVGSPQATAGAAPPPLVTAATMSPPPPVPASTARQPAPATNTKPAPAPVAAPTAASPRPAGDACPTCGRQAPKGQRYCMFCDMSF